MKPRTIASLALLLAAGGAGFLFHERMEIGFNMILQRLIKKSVADRLAEFGPATRARMNPSFVRAGVKYPPESVTRAKEAMVRGFIFSARSFPRSGSSRSSPVAPPAWRGRGG